MKHLLPCRYRALGAVVGGYTLAAAVAAVVQRNGEFLFYSVVLALIAGVVVWLDRRSRLPMFVLWGLAAWGLAHLLGGMLPIPRSVTEPPGADGPHASVLYNLRLLPWLPKYDQVVHALGFFAASLAAWGGLRATYDSPPRVGAGLFMAVVLLGMGLGALNEVVEFAATRLMPETNVGDYVNNATDLVFNAMGATIAGVVVWVRGR